MMSLDEGGGEEMKSKVDDVRFLVSLPLLGFTVQIGPKQVDTSVAPVPELILDIQILSKKLEYHGKVGFFP